MGWYSERGCCLASSAETCRHVAPDSSNSGHRGCYSRNDAWFARDIRPNQAVNFFSKTRSRFSGWYISGDKGHSSCCDPWYRMFTGSRGTERRHWKVLCQRFCANDGKQQRKKNSSHGSWCGFWDCIGYHLDPASFFVLPKKELNSSHFRLLTAVHLIYPIFIPRYRFQCSSGGLFLCY